MSSPTTVRLAHHHAGSGILQVVTYYERGDFLAALQEYTVDPATGRTVLDYSMTYTSEAAAIADWLMRTNV